MEDDECGSRGEGDDDMLKWVYEPGKSHIMRDDFGCFFFFWGIQQRTSIVVYLCVAQMDGKKFKASKLVKSKR